MWTTDDNHGAQTQFHSGRHMLDGEFPTLGAWVHYGLGSLNDNLPQFISMGNREYWNDTRRPLPRPRPRRGAAAVDPANPLDYGRPEVPVIADDEQQVGFDLVGRLNQLRAVEYPDDPALAARIKSYELAFRMQRSLPEVLDFDGETAARRSSCTAWTTRPRATFGMQLLAARRLVERGVRFIQIQHGGGGAGVWDAHGGSEGQPLAQLPRRSIKPIAGLLKDLKRRGLLDETIVVFATEFGRTPGSQGGDGRDHHIYGFSVLAGRRRHQGRRRPRRDRRDRLPRRRGPPLRHRHPRHDPAPARPRLAPPGDPRPQAARHRPRQADRRDHGVKLNWQEHDPIEHIHGVRGFCKEFQFTHHLPNGQFPKSDEDQSRKCPADVLAAPRLGEEIRVMGKQSPAQRCRSIQQGRVVQRVTAVILGHEYVNAPKLERDGHAVVDVNIHIQRHAHGILPIARNLR